MSLTIPARRLAAIGSCALPCETVVAMDKARSIACRPVVGASAPADASHAETDTHDACFPAVRQIGEAVLDQPLVWLGVTLRTRECSALGRDVTASERTSSATTGARVRPFRSSESASYALNERGACGQRACHANLQFRGGLWSGAGSNRRPHDFQSRALPTELPDRGVSTWNDNGRGHRPL
jgi:hypothetical protein